MGEVPGKGGLDAAALIRARIQGRGLSLPADSATRFLALSQHDTPGTSRIVKATPEQVARIAGDARPTEKIPVIPPLQFGREFTPEVAECFRQMRLAAEDLERRRLEGGEQAGLTRLFGNASLAEAKIIGLAESHTPRNHAHNAVLIAGLAHEGDIHLVEGVARGQKASNRSRYRRSYPVPDYVEVEGWEDMEAHGKARSAEAALYQARRVAYQASKIGTVEEQQQARESEAAAEAAYFQAAIIDRAPSFRRAITEAADKSPGGVFVSAGKDHFTQDAQLIEELDQYPFCIVRPVPESQ